MSIYSTVRDEASDAISEIRDAFVDTYTYNPRGPIPSLEYVANKVFDRIPSPRDRIWHDDDTKGAETVTIFSRTDAAFDKENFISMFARQKLSLFDGHIEKGSKKSKIFAPFSMYTPTSLWPWQGDDGSRYTVHSLAYKDIGISDSLERPIEKLLRIDLDIDQDGASDWGGLPLFNWIADPLLGLGPIVLMILIGYLGTIVVPSVLPLLIAG
tara:strand:+ start:3952 stop:4587 length:636 start_codon:yes stop_codon:yes gene_type:complete